MTLAHQIKHYPVEDQLHNANWYVEVRQGAQTQYLHDDGSLHQATTPTGTSSGWFTDRGKARAAVDLHLQQAVSGRLLH